MAVGWTHTQRTIFLMIAAIIEFGILSDIPAMIDLVNHYNAVFVQLQLLIEGDEGPTAYNLLGYMDIIIKCETDGKRTELTEDEIMAEKRNPLLAYARADRVDNAWIQYDRDILIWANNIRPILRYLLYLQIFRQSHIFSDSYKTEKGAIQLAQQLFDIYKKMVAALTGAHQAISTTCNTLPDIFTLYFNWNRKPR